MSDPERKLRKLTSAVHVSIPKGRAGIDDGFAIQRLSDGIYPELHPGDNLTRTFVVIDLHIQRRRQITGSECLDEFQKVQSLLPRVLVWAKEVICPADDSVVLHLCVIRVEFRVPEGLTLCSLREGEANTSRSDVLPIDCVVIVRYVDAVYMVIGIKRGELSRH